MSHPGPPLNADERELYLALGREIQSAREDTPDFGLESLRTLKEGRESVGDLVNLGHVFFSRISRSAYAVVCGASSGSEDWKSLVGMGETALIGAVSALLVAHLAMIAPVAAAVAAIIVKIFYNAASKEVCSLWKANLDAPSE